MNCEEVQKQLSDLLDKSLDVERVQEIQEHLVACSVCTAEMASLTEYQDLMSSLPIIEPPMGFTARVMAEVREAGHSPSLWERWWFLPLQIKVPLQATAVVLIAVLAAYIYQKQPLQPESEVSVQPASSFKKQEDADKLAPSIAQAPRTDSKTTEVTEQAKLRVQQFKDSAQLKKPQLPPKPEEQNKGIAGSQPDAAATTLSQDQVRPPVSLGPTPPQETKSAANEPASPRLEQYSPPVEVLAKRALPQPEKENASKDAASSGKPLLPAEALGRSATSSSLNALGSGTVVGVALLADHELAIRLKEPGRDDKAAGDRLALGGSEAERRSLTSQEEAKNLDQARQQAIQTGQQQTAWVTIARNQYELFKKQLADLGNIEAESSTPDRKNDAVDKSSDQLQIKVTILPPLSFGNPVRSQPPGR